jgi:hypothetical protein
MRQSSLLLQELLRWSHRLQSQTADQPTVSVDRLWNIRTTNLNTERSVAGSSKRRSAIKITKAKTFVQCVGGCSCSYFGSGCLPLGTGRESSGAGFALVAELLADETADNANVERTAMVETADRVGE